MPGARNAERRIGAERFGWAARRAAGADTGRIKRGLGVAQSHWLSVIHPPTICEVRIADDGSVEAFTSAQDVGTGTRTILAQTVAEELGLEVHQVGSYIGDTRYPPGPPSGGSRVTGSLTPAARNAAYQAGRELARRLAPVLGVKAEDVVFRDGHVGVPGSAKTWLTLKDAIKKPGGKEISARGERHDDYDGYMAVTPEFAVGKHGIGGVQFAEVVVDTETGSVKVERIVAVHDCGRPINPKLTESQVMGGVIQGLSYALYEERHLDAASGLQLNANIDQYKIAGAREMPRIEVHLLEQLTGQSSTDARGVAEPANVATAAALANAFFNATGKRIRTLPMTPANVLAALRDGGGRSRARGTDVQTFEWIDGTSIEQAAALLKDGASGLAVAKAGGIDLVDLMKEGIVRPARVINLRTIPGLDGISVGPSGELRLGALVTLAQICESPEVLAHCPALAEAARHAATPQVRNAATIGGNLLQRPRCWYYRTAHFHQDGREPALAAISGEHQYHAVFDNTTSAMVHASTPATALAAYHASVEVSRGAGRTRTVPLESFLLPPDARRDRDAAIEPGEILTAVIVPASGCGHAQRVSQADRA